MNQDDVLDDEPIFDDEPALGIAGAVNVDVGLTINLNNYQSLKINIGLNEPYSGRNGNTREAKLDELFAFIQSRIDEKAVDLVVHNKELCNIVAQAIKDME